MIEELIGWRGLQGGERFIAQLTQSHVQGATDVPLIEQTIGACFDAIADKHAGQEALVVRHQGVRWTYAQLQRRVDGFAAGLLALGLRPGERIGIWAPNSAEWVVAQLATAKAGLILVTINPAYRLAELEYSLNKVGCRALITAAAFKTSNYIAMLRELAPEIASCPPGALVCARVPSLKTLICIGTEAEGFVPFDGVSALADARHCAERDAIAGALANTEPVNIQFTSGTTGSAKGALLSHRNLVNNAYFSGCGMGVSARDRYCICPPLYHCAGMVVGVLAAITHAATVVLPSEWFDPLASLEAIAAERCTIVGGVPTMFLAMLNHPEFARFDLTSLRAGFVGGAPCPVEMMKRCIADMHLRELTIVFGMTETSPSSLQTAIDDPLERRIGSVGRVHPHVELRIVDALGQTVPPGEIGEICVRGYSVMLGYWNDPLKTREAIDAHGWMHTGDLGVLDADGYANVVGRIKDMVIRGGENIYPAEIEEFLYRHPAIADAQVFGVPDDRFGEELCAWLRTKPGAALSEAEIRDFCKDRIAHFKVPRYVRFVEAFPMTVTGKMQKAEMRRRMCEMLGLTVQATA